MEDIASIFEDILSSDEKKEQLKSIASMFGIDPDAQFDMSSIGKILGNDNNDGDTEDSDKSSSSSDDFDFSKLFELKDIFSSAKSNNKNVDLLVALKPHLNEEHQKKIDQSIKLLKLLALVPILKEFGIFGGDLL